MIVCNMYDGDVLVYSVPVQELLEGIDEINSDLSFGDKLEEFVRKDTNQKYIYLEGPDKSLDVPGDVKISKIWRIEWG